MCNKLTVERVYADIFDVLKEEHYPSDITFLHDSFDRIICFKKVNGAKIPLSSYTFSTQFPLRDVLTAVLAENVSRI